MALDASRATFAKCQEISLSPSIVIGAPLIAIGCVGTVMPSARPFGWRYVAGHGSGAWPTASHWDRALQAAPPSEKS